MALREREPDYIKNKNIWIISVAGLKLKNSMGEIVPHRSVISLMHITDILDYVTYYNEYPKKRPERNDNNCSKYVGDNIYPSNDSGDYEGDNPEIVQSVSCHRRKSEILNRGHLANDLQGKYVLLSDDFIYFGKNNPQAIDEKIVADLHTGAGFKRNHSNATLNYFENLINNDWKEHLENIDYEFIFTDDLEYEEVPENSNAHKVHVLGNRDN